MKRRSLLLGLLWLHSTACSRGGTDAAEQAAATSTEAASTAAPASAPATQAVSGGMDAPAKPSLLDTPPPQGIERGAEPLAQAANELIKSCEVNDYGYVASCKSEDARRAFEAVEAKTGVKVAMLTYCFGLTDERPVIQALSAARIGRLAYAEQMDEHADEEVYQCLVASLPGLKTPEAARPVTRAVVYLGTALHKGDDVVAILEKTEREDVRLAGYNALWANGRMELFRVLASVLKSEASTALKVAVLRGFALGPELSPAEEVEVCQLVLPYVTDKQLELAGAAAVRVAAACPEAKDDVLDAAEKMLKRRTFDFQYVGALRGVKGYFSDKATPEQEARIAALAERVVAGEYSDLTRSSALQLVGDINPELAQRLAKEYENDPSPWIRRAAEKIRTGQTFVEPTIEPHPSPGRGRPSE